MEKMYAVRDIDILYFDGKILPVIITNKDNKIYANEILTNKKYELKKIVYGLETFNKGAQYIASLSTGNNIKTYGEVGSFANCICNYGKKADSHDVKIERILDLFKNFNKVDEKLIIDDFFKKDLTKNEIKEITNILQKYYSKINASLER